MNGIRITFSDAGGNPYEMWEGGIVHWKRFDIVPAYLTARVTIEAIELSAGTLELTKVWGRRTDDDTNY